MAIKKTKKTIVENKKDFPNVPGHEYTKVKYPDEKSAIEVFETLTGNYPSEIYEYRSKSGKFESWFIPLE